MNTRYHRGHLCADEDQIRRKLEQTNADLLAALESIRDGYQQLWDVMPVAWQGFDNIAEQAIEKARNG